MQMTSCFSLTWGAKVQVNFQIPLSLCVQVPSSLLCFYLCACSHSILDRWNWIPFVIGCPT